MISSEQDRWWWATWLEGHTAGDWVSDYLEGRGPKPWTEAMTELFPLVAEVLDEE